MERKPHGLLLLFEGLPATVIHSQVFARLNWLETEGLATFDVLAFAHTGALLAKSRRRARELQDDISGKVMVERGVRPAFPGSRFLNRRRLRRVLSAKPGRYSFIHARTDYSAAVAGPLAEELRLPMIWDCRGDSEGEFIERSTDRGKGGPLVAWRSRQYRIDGEIAARFCTAASFVSTSLETIWRGRLDGKPYVVLPCLADPRIFFFDQEVRNRERSRLGFKSDEIVFVYSGSLGHYQGFDLVAEWFQRAIRRLPRARLLVLTPQVEAARDRLSTLPADAVTVISAPFKEVNAALNAADYAFLLRPASRTNTAAFPTKFAEYGLTGLPVVMSDAVPDCYAIAKAAGNLVESDADPLDIAPSTDQRLRIVTRYRSTLTHGAMADRSHALYKAIEHATWESSTRPTAAC